MGSCCIGGAGIAVCAKQGALCYRAMVNASAPQNRKPKIRRHMAYRDDWPGRLDAFMTPSDCTGPAATIDDLADRSQNAPMWSCCLSPATITTGVQIESSSRIEGADVCRSVRPVAQRARARPTPPRRSGTPSIWRSTTSTRVPSGPGAAAPRWNVSRRTRSGRMSYLDLEQRQLQNVTAERWPSRLPNPCGWPCTGSLGLWWPYAPVRGVCIP